MGEVGLYLGDWVVQPSLNRIRRGEVTVHLRPKLMDILMFLAGHPGDVVPQQSIIEAVWARPFLAESVLTRCVAELRDVLGDDVSAPRYIETITKRGYRLIAPVEWSGAAPSLPRMVGEAQVETIAAGGLAGQPVRRGESGARATACFGVQWGEREIALAEGENVIGRVVDAAVRISSSKVSRRHARILVTGGRAFLEDLGSKNGTHIRGRRIRAVTELQDGDEIVVGRDVLVFRFCYPMGSTATDDPA